jgi:S1-C subfamily serine protease
VLTVAWMIAVPVASAPIPDLAGQVRNSAVIRTVDRAMPGPVRNVYASLRRTVDSNGFPDVLNALDPTRVVSVAPVDPALANLPAVTKVHGSVLKVLGVASSCNREIEGSSFVYAPQHVLTNAHVVAGTSRVTVETQDGRLDARVVRIDPRRDVAVLYVPGLKAATLEMPSTPASSGQNAIVLGYPQNGSFDVQPARIRDRQTISGQDIYGNGSVNRDIYTIRSTVRPGNSGGPLIDTSGRVLGIVFASALDSSDTGFVLTNAEVAADAAAGRTATAAVSTGTCD